MIKQPRRHQTQLLVIGSGLAGMAASLFALARGVSVAQVGNSGAIAFTTGYLDLLGHDGRGFVDDPWQALVRLREDEPRHPLANIAEDDIRAAFTSFTRTLTEMGLGYTAPGQRNVLALTPAGTLKPTLSLPLTMQPAIRAMARGLDTLVVDFIGLNGFSAREVVANLAPRWPGLRALRIGFPDMDSGAEVYAEVLARAMEVPATRQRLAERIAPLLGSAQALGLPAILGVHRPDHVHRELQSLLGVPVFEIPTMPPAVPGVRLRELFETQLPQRGVALEPQHRVKRLELLPQGVSAQLEDAYGEVTIEAAAAMLATGRFTSGGLRADPNANPGDSGKPRRGPARGTRRLVPPGLLRSARPRHQPLGRDGRRRNGGRWMPRASPPIRACSPPAACSRTRTGSGNAAAPASPSRPRTRR